MSNSCVMSFPDKHKVTAFSCEKWFGMFRIANLFIISSLSWFSSKMPLVALINLQSIKKSIFKLYIRQYFGQWRRSLLGFFWNRWTVGGSKLHISICCYSWYVVPKKKRNCWQGGWLHSQQHIHTQAHALLSDTIPIFRPTWSKTPIRMDRNPTNHITSKSHGPPPFIVSIILLEAISRPLPTAAHTLCRVPAQQAAHVPSSLTIRANAT